MISQAFDFELPHDLHATHPPERRGIRRDHVRMMVLNKETGEIAHDQFFRLHDYMNPGDLIVLNNSRTIPAVLKAEWRRNSQILCREIEMRMAKRKSDNIWDVLFVTEGVNTGDFLQFSHELSAIVISSHEKSPLKTIQFSQKGSALFNSLYSLGEPIRYEYINQPWELEYYQTVFASQPGSLEMPSAGRAFSWELLFQLQKKGVHLAFLQLHTGLSYLLDDSFIQSPEDSYEEYHIPMKTMELIQKTKGSGGRVIAAGTTVVRALETAAASQSLSGITNLYVHRNFPLNLADGIITGFHEPKASHLDMLSAFVSEEHLFSAYGQAIKNRYLWHEFGDMNLIL